MRLFQNDLLETPHIRKKKTKMTPLHLRIRYRLSSAEINYFMLLFRYGCVVLENVTFISRKTTCNYKHSQFSRNEYNSKCHSTENHKRFTLGF